MSSTLKDVARLAGVSITTVSHALNGTRFVDPETARRVREAAESLNYAPNSVARGLRTGTSKTIGVVGPSALDPFFAGVLVGIEAACYAAGYELYIGYVEYPHGDLPDGSPAGLEGEKAWLRRVLAGEYRAPCPPCPDAFTEKEGRVVAKLVSRDIDGLIIHPGQPGDAARQTLAGIRPKLILFHRSIEGVDADVFVADDYSGFRAAIDDLLARGHRRIGVVYGYSWEGHAARERFRAYREALLAAGIEPDAGLHENGGYDIETAATATRRLLALSDPPTAIMYWSDYMAIAGMDAARELGLSVPTDLSVVGFDDLPIVSRTRPRLSSVDQRAGEMGAAMALRMIERIESREDGPSRVITSPAEYKSRESVSAPRALLKGNHGEFKKMP